MHFFTFGLIAIIFFIIAYNVGIKRKIYLISTVDKSDLDKIENKDKVAKGFGAYYLFLGIISILCMYVTKTYGAWGMGASTILLMILFLISVIAALKLYWFK